MKLNTRSIAAVILTALTAIFGLSLATTPAGATGHPTWPHPQCEDDVYGNAYCDTTTVPPTTVKCPPHKTTTTTVVTTTVKPTTTTTEKPRVTTTTVPEVTTTTEILPFPPPRIEEKLPTPVAVNSPEFKNDTPAPQSTLPGMSLHATG